MERKKKECQGCGKLSFLWARGRCKLCDQRDNPEKHGAQTLNKATGRLNSPSRTMYSFDKYKKRRAISPVSDKKAKELAKYRKLRDEYLKIHASCEAKVDPVCIRRPVELHHLKPRAYHLCDTDVFMAVCRRCHEWIEANDKEARAMGLKMNHL